MTLHFQSAGRTATGKVRRRNEDAILVRDEVGLWAVADGLGGHVAGDYASRLIVERLGGLSRTGDVFDFVAAIEDTLHGVNTDLRCAAQARGADIIGSTVVLLVHDRDRMLCGWVGDSRAYCFDGTRLTQLTRDHVYDGWDGVSAGTGDAPRQQPAGRGVLSRAVGAGDALVVDWVDAVNRPDVQFVLCSDGVNKELTDAEIETACQRGGSPDAVLREVFDLSLSRAARDNISAVIVQLQG